MVTTAEGDGEVPLLTEAEIEIWRANIRNDTFGRYHREMGMAIEEKEKNYDAAIEHYRRALSYRSDFFDVHYRLVGALQAVGRHDDGAAARAAAEGMAPDYEIRALIPLCLRDVTNGNVSHARKILQEVQARAPERPEVRIVEALFKVLDGSLKESDCAVLQTAAIATDHLEELAEYFLEKATEARAKPDLPLAVAALKAALTFDPESTQALLVLSEILPVLGRQEDAEAALTAMLEQEPNNWQLFLNRALAREQLPGKVAQVVEDCERAVAIFPESSLVQVRTIQLLQRRGRQAEAELRWRDRMATAPSDIQVDVEIGSIKLVCGEIDETIREVERLAVKDMPSGVAYRNYQHLALAYLAKQQRDEFEAALVKVVSARNNQPAEIWAESTRSLFLLNEGRADEATTLARRALEKIGGSHSPIWCLSNLALVLAASGQAEEAARLHRQSIEIMPGLLWYFARIRTIFFLNFEEDYERLGFTTTPFWPTV